MSRRVAELLLVLSLFLLLGLTAAGQEIFEVVGLHELKPPLSPHPPPPIALSVAAAYLPALSSSTLSAEQWVGEHVLPHLQSANIASIVVGEGLLCSGARADPRRALVLPSALNLHYSLLKQGLLSRTRVAISFSHCSPHHLDSTTLRRLLEFLRDSRSLYSIATPIPPLPSHRATLEKLGFPHLTLVALRRAEGEHIARRLHSFPSSPYGHPELPKQFGSSTSQSPAAAPTTPQSPSPPSSIPFAPAPDGFFSFVPVASPSEVPWRSPHDDPFGAPPLPPAAPCVAAPAPAPAPAEGGEKGGLWCVAKPTVPAETLQEAMDYACGEGGADCDEIKPTGNCYFPDNVVAHASFAFNSYWQRTKRNGGSCGFGGTAILISSDPSFQHCRFELN